MKTDQFSWNSDRFPPVFGELSLVPAPSPPTIDPQTLQFRRGLSGREGILPLPTGGGGSDLGHAGERRIRPCTAGGVALLLAGFANDGCFGARRREADPSRVACASVESATPLLLCPCDDHGREVEFDSNSKISKCRCIKISIGKSKISSGLLKISSGFWHFPPKFWNSNLDRFYWFFSVFSETGEDQFCTIYQFLNPWLKPQFQSL
jgi:hypothetical protein